jgi:hypothetical protein
MLQLRLFGENFKHNFVFKSTSTNTIIPTTASK